MNTSMKLATTGLLMASAMEAHAKIEPGPPGAAFYFLSGAVVGLGIGLLICWWRCRRKKTDDKPLA